MASMRDIKRRKVTIQSTQQITKAMKLVSTVKFQKAKVRAEVSGPYFKQMYSTVSSLLSKAGNLNHPFLQSGKSDKVGVISITSNRGLAGGYNSNVVKLIADHGINPDNAVIYNIGSKGKDFFLRKHYEIKEDMSDIIEEPTYEDAREVARAVLRDFADEKIGEIYLAYTDFKNTVTHIPTMLKLLPVELDQFEQEEDTADDKTKMALMTFEPEASEALDLIVPKYVTSLIYGGLTQAVASENGARMQAMDNATNNAEEMIEDLSLKYNRARQGSITQEITEIIAGADAL